MKNRIETNSELWQYVEKHREAIEKSLREFLPLAPSKIETKFNEAVEYALFSGGKRLRPVLTLLGAELFGGRAEDVIPAAVAGEFIHTSSLIFDDLPAMDNASERRGKTSLHEKFGEGLAILVAIGFLNSAYGLVFVGQENNLERAINAQSEIIECVGAAGMIGGQAVDLSLAKGVGVHTNSTFDFESVRNLKTSALMRLSLSVGAILAGANASELKNLSLFAKLLGDAYQLSDDLIDLEEDGEIFAEKHFALNEKESARIRLFEIVENAKDLLEQNFPENNARVCLAQLTDYLVERKL